MLSLLEIPLHGEKPAFQKGDFSAIFSPMFTRIWPLPWNLLLDLFHESSYAAMHNVAPWFFLIIESFIGDIQFTGPGTFLRM
jgi:hypothetical protein